jgi:hypothetical protein
LAISILAPELPACAERAVQFRSILASGGDLRLAALSRLAREALTLLETDKLTGNDKGPGMDPQTLKTG